MAALNSVLLGRGDGSFYDIDDIPLCGTKVPGRPHPWPQWQVEVGDFAGDGIVDYAVADHADNSVLVGLGLGDGHFQNEISYPAGNRPIALTAFLDHNALVSLVVDNGRDGSVSVLQNEGGTAPGPFGNPGLTNAPAGDAPVEATGLSVVHLLGSATVPQLVPAAAADSTSDTQSGRTAADSGTGLRTAAGQDGVQQTHLHKRPLAVTLADKVFAQWEPWDGGW